MQCRDQDLIATGERSGSSGFESVNCLLDPDIYRRNPITMFAGNAVGWSEASAVVTMIAGSNLAMAE